MYQKICTFAKLSYIWVLPASVGDRHKQDNGDKQNDKKPRRN